METWRNGRNIFSIFLFIIILKNNPVKITDLFLFILNIFQCFNFILLVLENYEAMDYNNEILD